MTHDEDVPRLLLAPFSLLLPCPSTHSRNAADPAHSNRHRALSVLTRRQILESNLDPCSPDLGDIAIEDGAQLLAHRDEIVDLGGRDEALDRLLDDVEDVVKRGREVRCRGIVGLVHLVRLPRTSVSCVPLRRRCGHTRSMAVRRYHSSSGMYVSLSCFASSFPSALSSATSRSASSAGGASDGRAF